MRGLGRHLPRALRACVRPRPPSCGWDWAWPEEGVQEAASVWFGGGRPRQGPRTSPPLSPGEVAAGRRRAGPGRVRCGWQLQLAEWALSSLPRPCIGAGPGDAGMAPRPPTARPQVSSPFLPGGVFGVVIVLRLSDSPFWLVCPLGAS